MKLSFMLALCTLVMSSAMARSIILRQDTPVYELDSYDRSYAEKGTFLAGTEIVLYDQRERVPGLGSAVLIKRILQPGQIRSDYRYSLALEINRTSHYNNFAVREADLEGRVIRDRRDMPRRDIPRRDVVVRREPVRRDVVVRRDFNEYQVCYETPRSRVVTMNHAQRNRGNRNVVGGLLGAIGGQVIGGITGNDNLGNVISAVGLGFAAVGAVQVASSQEVFYTDYDVDCRSYYTADTRIYNFRRQGQRCSTTRYYTNRWGSQSEYFETTCHGSRSTRYVSFERSYDIYAY